MALFGSKKNKDADKQEEPKAVKPAEHAEAKKTAKPKTAKKAAKDSVVKTGSTRDVSHVLKHPRITEKATAVSESSSVYVFDIDPRSTKNDVIEAVRRFYKAEPVKVNVAAVPSKRVFVRGKWGVKSGGKKAYVYLKKGETIEII